MPEPDKIGQLYDALKADGAIEHQSESDFRSYMGSEANSRALYGALKSDGAIESSSYEDFRDRLGLHAVKPQQPVAKPVQTQVQTQLQPVATGGHDGEGGAIESHGNGRSVGEAQPAPAMASSLPVSGVDVKTVVPDKDGSGNTVGNDNVAPGRGWDVNGKHFTSLDDSLRYIEEQDAIPGRGWKIGDKEFGSAEDADRYVKSHPEMRFRFMSRDGVRFDNMSDLVRHRRERDAAEMVERRISSALTAYDPDNVAESVWDDAERRSAQDFGDYLSSRREVSVGNVLHDLASAGDVSGGLGADNYEVGIQAFASHLKYHDLRRMADEAWERLGKEKRDAVVGDIYGALRERYPDADSSALMSNASAIAKEQSDKRMFELAVEKHAPQSATDYFFRKAFTSNALYSLMVGLARYQSGSIGDMEARDVADQRYGEDHKLANIAGIVTGMAIDPLTWIAGGVGGAASKGAMWLGGKLAGDAVMRKFGSSLAGRMLGGVVGGAAYLGVFEAGGELLEQQKWGGAVGVSPETGHYEVGDYDLGAVGARFVHGMAMGAGTGMVAPLIGNVSDKLVRATESTVGKLGIRAGELGVSTVAEGTIFSIPEWIEGNRDAMDVWTDNMAMMAGFKAQHLLKSAPRVIRELSSVKNPRTQEERIQNRMGFESRLRKALDGRPDLALTEDEKKELERRGYGDLKDLTEEYSRYAEAKEEYDKARPTTTDASRMIEGGDGQAELPYNRFVELMTDNSVSEAARAKMYYYLTGHGLPMSTVMGSSVLEDKDADGNVTGYTVQSFGANGVITSRSFGDKKRADVEVNRINRQAELNGFDVGERYYDWQGDNKRMYEACETVAEETGAPANLLFDLMKRKTEAMNEIELEWAEKILNAYNGLGDKYGSSEVRTAINEEFGVDVDKAIRKERNRRSEQEQKAASEYASRLFADVKRKQEEAAERGEAPVDPDAPTSNSQIAALLGIDDGEQGDPVSAAFNRGHEADAQERQDIAIEVALATQHTGLGAGEAQEAWNGVVQRINEDAAYMVAQQREQTKQMQHTDGSLRPAILKEKDSEGNDQKVYIVDGNVQMMPDGSMVDKASSDNIVVVYNPATGERKQIDPSADTGISSLGEVTTAEQREADIERSRQEYVQAQIDEAQGTVRFVPGQQLVLPTGEGAVVVATDADGENITVALGDGTQATVQRSELQRIRDEKAAADYRQRHGIDEAAMPSQHTEQPQAGTGGVVAGAPADYTADMELTIRDEDGSEKPAMVMGRVRYENGSFVPDANGNIIEYFMDGEVKHDHEDKLVDKVVSHVAPVQPEQGNNTSENIPVQGNNAGENIPQTPIETPAPAEPMPMREVGTGKNAETEPDWMAVTPERGHDWLFGESGLDRSDANEIVTNNLEAAQKAVDKASKLKPKKTTNPFTLQAERERIAGEQEAAQNALDYWKTVQSRQTALRNAELEQSRAEQAERDRIAHEQAVAEAQAEYEARKQAEAERKAVGNENPMPAITEKWNNATKVDGHRDEIMLPDGTPLKGHYVLHESGASSPSHNPETWQKTDGFPMDANDNSVNDRDYERDHDAQEHTQSIARQYDQRALQSVPVVSNDGVVLSGNGRTMAGELAARDNTDGAYVNYLKEYAPKFGFTPEQVEAMQHPRVSFVPDEAMPYTAETFAKFNQQEMKSQNKTEQAVKLGKTVSDDSFKGIVRTINGYDTLGDFYNDAQASLGAVYDLHNAGVVPQAQLAEMVDGVRGQEKLSAVGREFLENMLIGKAFEGDPEVVRMLTAEPAMRQTVITALGEIVDNIALGGDWSLQGELADAVKLCFDARQGGAKYGEIVSTYARQGVLFADPDELQTVADFNNATMLMLADVLNDKRVTLLKTTLQLYNNNARQSASGQTDLFAGGIQNREDILRDVITFINENYGKRKEIEAARAEAVERRKAESVQQDGTPPAVNSGSEDTGRSERSTEKTPTLTHDEAISLIAQMEERAGVAPEMELTIENWDAQFGEDGRVVTPIGEVKMGENQFTKLMRQGREGKLGMIKPTLENPDVIIEDASEAKEDDVAERNSSYVFVKAFKKADGSRYYYFTSVTVSKDGKEVVISNQEKRKNAIANLLTKGKLVWKHADDVSAASDVEQGLYSSQGKMSDPTTEGTDAPQTNDVQKGKLLYRFDGGAQTEQTPASVSVTTSRTNPGVSIGKDSEKSATVQGKGEKVAENQSPNSVQVALAAAEQETNTEPTEAQKEAGNYKKGHVKIDGYDVTIENPKGSVRRGTDASGKQWEQEMQNTYGYIRGTEGVDGDHIDVFFSEDPSQGDVFVVDQVNKDGSFDEHKVMYGFPDIESARKAYLSNYKDGWQGLGAITPVSKEEFKKWIDSSHRKTKPFAEYSSVKPLGDTQLGEQPNKPTVKAGEDYVSAAERIAKEHEVKRTAAHFAEETQEESAAFDKRVPEMDDVELLAYMQEDGRGDLNKAHHPSVYDEYDYRHGDEQLQSYDDTLVRLNESGTTLEQAEEMLANIQKDVSRLATEDRAMLLGQEEALQEYIAGLEKEGERDVAIPSQQTEQNESDTTSSTIKENGRLSELRTKNPGRVFGEQHEDGSVTFHDEDAMLVSELLGREFDGEDLTLPKKEADKALQKLLANGYKAGFYGDEYKPKYDEHGNLIEQNTDPQPIGKGMFGNIYDQFRGRLKEAFDFLIKHKSGDLLGVFHRDGFGDIDLVWGDKGGGAEHIIDKHVGDGKSFATEEEAFTEIDRIIKTGKKDFENGDKVVFKDGNKIVTVRKNWREKGKKIADKNWVLTAYDETSADSESPVATNKSLAGSATSVSAGKGTDLFGNAQGSGKKSSSDGKIDDVGEVLAGARKDMRKEIAKSLANVTEAALVEKPFGKVYKKPDLKKAKEKLAEYEELMKAEMAEKEAKYAEMDASVEAAKGVQLSDEDSDDVTEDTAKYRIREDEPPTKTGIGYKVFVLKDGKLYPPMVANPNGEATPVGVWLDADAAPVAGVTKTGRQQVKAGGKGTQGGSGKLAYRPGWHLGEIPYALQFNRMNPETGQRELFPANFVWAEVEYANDVDYQEEAMSYGMNASGKFQHSLAGLPRLPENGSYRYRTNPDPNTDPWVITGAMKVNRILKPSEVDAMVEAAGREPQQRQAGAITDEQVEALNAKVKRTMKSDRDMMRTTAEQMGAKLNTRMNIIEDVNDITHPNKEIEKRRRRSKGWFDTATGEVVIVLPNNRDVEDVAATIGHETVAHKGLRELVGEDNYNDFLDETYKHLRNDLKKGVDDAAGRAFIDDTTKNGKRAKSYEQHRRTAVDELFGRMAEKPFEEFSEGERTLWQKMCHVIRRLLDKFLGTLKLPKWFELGDNELRYMLWRSKERLERGKEHPIDLARDIVKREELGLTDEARYNMGDAPETFKARQRRAAENKGTVMPGLNDAQVKVVDVPRHPYTGSIKEASKQAIDAAKAKFVPNGEPKTLHYNNFGAEFDYSISGKALKESLNPKQQEKSDSRGVHLAVAEHLDEVIGASIEVEEHPDYLKNEHGERDTRKVNADALMHRFYGAITVEGKSYRVMTLMREDRNVGNGVHAYEVTKIEVLDGQTTKPLSVSSRKSNTPNDSHGLNSELEAHDLNGRSNVSDVFVSVAKLLNNLEKSYDSGKKILDESKLADESTDLYRDPEETEDIWTDGSLGLDEMITRAAVRLSDKHRADKTMKMDAMRAICDNLADLAKSMLGHPRKKDLTDAERRSVDAKVDKVARSQMRFDQTTVKRVNDLARVLISSGYLNNLTAGEVKRLLSAVKNSVGHNDIEGDVQKVMDIMVDNQLKHAEDTLHELEAIRGSKVDARGVEVQGQLDPAGQVMLEAFKDGRRLTREALEEEIGKALDRMSSESESVRADAENAYAGLQFALQYADRIADSEHEEKVLRDELKQKHDETSERDRATDSYRQYVSATEDAIRQNKIERAQAYHDLVAAMTDGLRESVANAQKFKENERRRVQDIHHLANSDMQGVELRGQRPDSRLDRWNENGLLRFGLSPLHTFDQFMRLFGRKNADGKGYLYDHFVRGYIDSADHEQLMKEKYEGKLEAKVKELFGTHKVAGGLREVPYTYTSLYGYVDALPMTKVTYYDGAGKREYELSQAQLAYLYMVDKMPMGKATNRRMGVTEEVIGQIEESLDAKLKEFADWVQEEFLVELGNECNEVHKRMFGANMANIENYFPFVRDKNSIKREVENGGGESMAERISTKTGAIIKRTPSVANWDMPNANFLDVLAKHVSEMCQWSSYAELNRDLGTLQSYNRFKQQVLGMRTIYGSGDALWKRFMQTCAIAGNAYEPKRGEADKLMVQGAKGVVMGKIAFRPMTAMKQLLSLPAFFGEVDMECLSKDFATGGIASVKWAWENMPNFRKRIKSRTAGDFRLSATKYDKEKGWTNTLMRISAYGMLPNIGVDAWTIALGSHAVYVKAKKKYLRQGYSEEKAERRAVQDAELCFNKSQQSSEGAFMAPVQIDHTFASTTMMLFRNSSTSYTRECVTSVRNLKRMMSGEVDVNFMAKQLLRNAEIPTFSMLFDAELQRQVEGTLPVGHIYSLGMPGGVLQSAGFPDAPIELSSTRLAEKSSDPGHPFPIEALKGLVDALNDPVAVFNYGNNAMNVIVGLEYKGKHFLVGVHFNQQHRGTSVSDIRGLFPKDNAEWLNWISQGKARYLDHKRIKALITQQRINLAEVDYLDLKDVAKVMKSFVNPAIPEQKYFAGWRAEDVERAREQARKEYRSGYIRNSVNAVMFGFILPWLWRIGGLSILLTLGDDDDDKVSEVKKASKQSLFGPLEGIAYGDVIADGLYVSANKLFGDGTEKFSNLGRTNPFLSDLADVLRKLDGDKMAAVNDVLNMLVGMNTGVNLQTVSDWATAILDYSPDGDTSREVSLLVSRLLNAPQSQIEKIYFDEIGMSGVEALRQSPRELVERYAQYKVKREHFVTPWVWGDEALLDKKRKKGKTIVKERTEQMGDDKVNEAYLQYEEVYKGVDAKVKEAKKTAKTDYVEAAQLMADAQSDPNAFATYQMFKQMDGNFNKIVKFYLGAKTTDEATLCRQAVLDYKAAMVKVLDAPDAATRAEAMGNLGNVMQEFGERYGRMQENNR